MKRDTRLGAARWDEIAEAAFTRLWENMYEPALQALFSDGVPPGIHRPTIMELKAAPMDEAANTMATLIDLPMSRPLGLDLAAKYLDQLSEVEDGSLTG